MTLFGPDLSSAQAGIDAGKLPGDFVIIKATGGKSYVNPFCDTWYQQAKRAGKRRAVYHFVHDPGHEGTAAEEAHWFLQNARGYLGDAIFIVDWEGDNVADTAYAMEFKRIVETEGRVRVMAYADMSHLEYVRALYNANSPVWAAGYSLGYQPINGFQPPVGPIGVPAGMNVSMWQFTSTGRLPGWNGNLDLNVFYGDGGAWDKLAARLPGASTPAPAPAPVAAPKPAPAPVPRPAAPRPPVSQCRVTAGDTLTSIAAQFGTTVAGMIAANPGINPNVIGIGQILNLPGHASAPAVKQCRVTSGDTLTSIARQFGTTVQHLIQVNPGINPNVIHIDQILNL